jgi:two-component system chemotaxis response regulator CheB
MDFKIVVIGASLGGFNALQVILAQLPKDLPVAVAIAQHRHRYSNGELITYLQETTVLPVREAEDKQPITPGIVFLAPADYHLLIEPGYFALSKDAPVTYARPSIDVLFESAADAYEEQVIGIILTGASNDGAKGLAKIQAYGGTAIVQKPDTAECPVMPEAAIKAVKKPQILPLAEIVPFLNSQIKSQVLI